MVLHLAGEDFRRLRWSTRIVGRISNRVIRIDVLYITLGGTLTWLCVNACRVTWVLPSGVGVLSGGVRVLPGTARIATGRLTQARIRVLHMRSTGVRRHRTGQGSVRVYRSRVGFRRVVRIVRLCGCGRGKCLILGRVCSRGSIILRNVARVLLLLTVSVDLGVRIRHETVHSVDQILLATRRS